MFHNHDDHVHQDVAEYNREGYTISKHQVFHPMTIPSTNHPPQRTTSSTTVNSIIATYPS